jgi:hypothetical protein
LFLKIEAQNSCCVDERTVVLHQKAANNIQLKDRKNPNPEIQIRTLLKSSVENQTNPIAARF